MPKVGVGTVTESGRLNDYGDEHEHKAIGSWNLLVSKLAKVVEVDGDHDINLPKANDQLKEENEDVAGSLERSNEHQKELI